MKKHSISHLLMMAFVLCSVCITTVNVIVNLCIVETVGYEFFPVSINIILSFFGVFMGYKVPGALVACIITLILISVSLFSVFIKKKIFIIPAMIVYFVDSIYTVYWIFISRRLYSITTLIVDLLIVVFAMVLLTGNRNTENKGNGCVLTKDIAKER